MAVDQYKPILWGVDGKPLSKEGALLAPNALNVANVIQNAWKVYPHTWDEAMRDAPQNALAMRRDPFYRSMLQERTAPTINLDWEVWCPNEDDPVQKLQRDTMQRAWDEVPDKPNLMHSLTDGALWWGRAGQQGMWGESDSGLTNWLYHEPVHGDSIQYQWDRTPVILIGYQQRSRIEATDPEAVVTGTTRGAYGLRLYKPEYRRRFVLHTHVREASDYYEGEMSGGVHGVGLRSWVYWGDYVRRDTLAAMMGFMNSTGMMDILVFNYPDGNPQAEARATANAKKVTGKFALICPRNPSDSSWKAVEQISMNTAGIEVVQNLLENYFDRYTRELFVGQSMSNGGGGPGGLEGDGRAELAGDTKFQLCKTDARRLGETLTRDWLIPCRDFNFPGSRIPLRMQPVLADPKAKEKAQNIAVCVANGIEIEEDEARRALGFTKPREGKKTIGGKPATDPNAPPGQPPGAGGAVARPPSPPKPEGGHDLATDFLHRLGRLESAVLYRAAQPPWPGAVFDEQKHRWVNPDGSGGPGPSGHATTGPKGQRPAPELGGADKDDILKGIDADLAEWDGDPPPEGLIARAKDVALTVAAKTYVWAMHATHSKAMESVAEVLGVIFDLPSDMAKLGYNPGTSSQTSNPGVRDDVKGNLTDVFGVGVSGHVVASIASKVLVKAAYWVRNRVKGDEQPTALSLVALLYDDLPEPDGYFEWAEFIATVLQRVAKGIGSDAPQPDAATIETNLRKLVDEKGNGGRATTYGFDESGHIGFTRSGELWFSNDLYQLLGYDDRVGLKLRLVTDKNGNRVHRWVREGTAGAAADHAGRAKTPGSDTLVDRALRDPGTLTADDVKALADHVGTLPKEQLRQLNLAFQQKIGGKKADLAKRLVEHVRGKGGNPDPRPQLPEPDYRHKDANDPIVKTIVGDKKAREVLDRVRAKAAAADAAKSAAFDAELAYSQKRSAYINAEEPGLFKKSKAWQAKADAYKKARDEYNDSFEAWSRAKEAELKARAAVREELVSALAHNTRSALREEWHDDTADTPFDTVALPKTDATRKVVSDAKAFVSSVCANLGEVPVSYGIATSGRAFARKNTGGKDLHAVAMSYEPGTATADAKGYSVGYATQVQVHELGHVIEFVKPGVEKLANEFVEYRCKGESPTDLQQRFPHNGFGSNEQGRKDDFDRAFGPGSSAYYVGKTYSAGSTEVISMGLEKLYADPAVFVKTDPEYAQFLFKVLTM